MLIKANKENAMEKITMRIDGMYCGMCETHVNDAVRNAARVRSVKSSYKKGETVIVTDGGFDEDAVITLLSGQGYRVTEVKREPYEKKGLFGFLKK